MTDCISRQAAIDALNEYFTRIGKLKRRGLTEGEKAISLDTVGAIKTLPSAQPIKHGHWIDMDEQSYTWKIRCSVCGHERSMMSTQGEYPNYCENCGAKMDGREE